MMLRSPPFVFLLLLPLLVAVDSDNSHNNASPSPPDLLPTHSEPQVAMVCEGEGIKAEKVINKYMDDTGDWVDDFEFKESCLTSKADILSYCKKVYPDKDITNIVESIRTYRLNNWCRSAGAKSKCKGTFWVKPYRCLQGAFQSEALLVPKKCQFDHLHNSSHCWNFDQWNVSAIEACARHKMSVLSFSVLIPCGVDMWEGVEFVCCPKEGVKDKTPVIPEKKAALKKPLSSQMPEEVVKDDDDDDLEDNSDESSDDYDGEDVGEDDPYLTHSEPKQEHASFMAAKERLQRKREKKINRIMEAWSKMEEKYKQMSQTDVKAAESYRKEMTDALRQEVSAVEEEQEAKKRQLVDLHQQRVLKNIAERKPEAEKCLLDALKLSLVNTHRVQKCMQKLLRALHKERHHHLNHYRHLLLTQPAEASSLRQLTLGRLVENDMTVNKSLDLLNKKPALRQKLLPLMQQYADALRTKDATPLEELSHINLLSRSRETEDAVLKAYEKEADAKKMRDARIEAIKISEEEKMKEKSLAIQANKIVMSVVDHLTTTKRPGQPPPPPVPFANHLTHEEKKMAVEDEKDPIVLPPPEVAKEGIEPIHTVSQIIDDEPIVVAHAMKHSLDHDSPSFTLLHDDKHRERRSQSAIVAVAFAGISLTLLVGVAAAVYRRRTASRTPRGFTAVDQAATPEERHVAKMQINGYENPTYRFFEEEG